MLLRFEAGNHRSIMSSIELSMIAVDDDRPATRGFERIPELALTVAAIYGANASGKSNRPRGVWRRRVRRSTNLERAYLQGRFGALPQVDTHEFRRALGLAAGGRLMPPLAARRV